MSESKTARMLPGETYLGPDTLLWQTAGDRRIYLMAGVAGVLQNMLPGVSAAITTQSVFFDEPVERLLRSIPKIVDTIYDQEMAYKVRDYHRDLKGSDHHGRCYHAMSPELYFAAHAVFVYTFSTYTNVFVRRLSPDEQEQFYADCKTWYRRYGVSARFMPETWADFCVYWDDLCENVLEDTPAAHRIVNDLYPNMGDYDQNRLPQPVWRLAAPLVGDQARLVTTALLPPVCRQKLGLEYSGVDRARFGATVATAKAVWPVLPKGMRDTRRARYAKKRALRLAAEVPGIGE